MTRARPLLGAVARRPRRRPTRVMVTVKRVTAMGRPRLAAKVAAEPRWVRVARGMKREILTKSPTLP